MESPGSRECIKWLTVTLVAVHHVATTPAALGDTAAVVVCLLVAAGRCGSLCRLLAAFFRERSRRTSRAASAVVARIKRWLRSR